MNLEIKNILTSGGQIPVRRRNGASNEPVFPSFRRAHHHCRGKTGFAWRAFFGQEIMGAVADHLL